MKKHYIKIISSFLSLFVALVFPLTVSSQSNPVALKPAIQINRVMTVENGVVRMVHDPVSGMLLYSNTSGDVYAIIQPQGGAAYDSLIYSVTHHSVQYLQGMAIHDSTLYVSGNNNSNTAFTTGIIARGKLQTNGSRTWDTLMITDPYQTGDYFDHLFSGLTVSLAGDSIFICSGARGDHGEVQDRYGAYPNLRNVPLTSNLYALPTHESTPILLQNDSVWHTTSVYLYARGIRNTFSMAFDADGNLFGVENSGDRDHNEEMNWLRRGKHYGFPWIMGDTYNPQQFPSFNPATDLLIPHFSRTWRQGFWNNDPGFPAPPTGLIFENPIQNTGPDCDKFRDTITGAVKDASDLGMTISTFTAHRSPLGLVFDNNQTLHPAYRGDGFMLSWTQGYDSCGCTTVPDTGIGTFVDPSQDLVHLNLSYDSTLGNFQVSATRIVGAFSHPIDAVIDSNVIFVIENGYGNTSGLYQITLPVSQACPVSVSVLYADTCSEGPATAIATPSGIPPYNIEWFDNSGLSLQTTTSTYTSDTLDLLSTGIYYVIVSDSAACRDSVNFTVRSELILQVDSATATTCIGCSNGIIYFSIEGAAGQILLSANPAAGTFSNDSLYNLPAGTYEVCVEDADGCMACDTITVLEDPSSVSSLTKAVLDIIVYPNPASGLVNILLKNSKGTEIKVRLLDVEGREQSIRILKMQNMTQGTEISLSLENIIAGNYILEVVYDGSLQREMLYIQK